MEERITRLLRRELREMEIPGRYRFEEIQQKEGRIVCRIYAEGTQYVLKYFTSPKAAQEIRNYQILGLEEIPTIPLLHYTERCLLLEDLTVSRVFRLADPGDLADEAVGRSLGHWYRILHDKGSRAADLLLLPRESDLLTAENLIRLRERFGDYPDWEFLRDTAQSLREQVEALPETLVYNDFAWENLAVSKDQGCALPFDYHLLGRGYRFGDVRNVCTTLTREAQRGFLTGYGSVNRQEARLDAAVSPLVALIPLCQSQSLPVWAETLSRQLKEGAVSRSWRMALAGD